MANVKIDDLIQATSLSDNMQLETDIDGLVSNKIDIRSLREYVQNPRVGLILASDMMNNVNSANFNGIGQVISGTGATNTMVSVTSPTELGVISCTTGTTSTGRSGYASHVAAVILGTGIHVYMGKIRLPQLSDGTESFTCKFGFGDAFSTVESVDGVEFNYTHTTFGGNFRFTTVNNSTRTDTDTGVAVAANTWYVLKIIVNTATPIAYGYINDTLVATHTTNIPTARETGYIACNILKTAGTTARAVHIDYFYFAWFYNGGAR